ncbi:MAG TPA: hypothetical protein VE422_33555 [Terriglobia bacterium]|nr:hypothetical protein [Terriglobia bacterium]
MRRLLILNLVLVAVLVAAAVRFHNSWIMFRATHEAGAIQPQAESLPRIVSTAVPNSAAPADWTDIPSRNPFSFDRTDIAILEPKAPPAPPPVPLGPKPILFGTVNLGKDNTAVVAPGQPAGNRNSKSMKVGEVIDGWKIVEISDKSIVIEANSVKETVIMNDPSALVQRDHTRTLASAPAVNVLPVTPAAAAPPPSTATSQPGAAQPQRRRVTQVTPFGTREIEITEPPK